MAKLNVSNTLSAALVALLTPVIAGAGKLWDGTRDAYVAARADFSPEDAAKAIRQVISDSLKANPKSVASYIQTCIWLEKNASQTPESLKSLTMGQATDLRYPKAPKPGQPGYVEHAAKLDKAAKDKAEAAERAAAEAATPRSQLLQQIAKMLATRPDDHLSLIAAEIAAICETLDAAPVDEQADSQEEETEAQEAAAG
jgi:hypothetical protein